MNVKNKLAMKIYRILSFAFTLSAIAALGLVSSCVEDEVVSPELNLKSTSITAVLEVPDCGVIEVSSIELTAEEITALNKVWNIELMAYDLYQDYSLLTANNGSAKPIFANLAAAEKIHMNVLYCLMAHFGLDPSYLDPGDLNENYSDWVSVDNMKDALLAGIAIENFEVGVLNETDFTNLEVIKSLFLNLSNGDGNHLTSLEKH